MGKYNIEIPQGADFNLVVTWKDSTGALVNLTGYAARMMVRNEYPDPSPIVSISTTPNSQGSIILGGVAGTVTLKIVNTLTATLTPGSGVYDLEMVYPNGTVERILEGEVEITPEVTK